jgi:hypothetical protein
MGEIYDIRNLITASCDFAVILLVLFSIAAIILFLRVFKSDFQQID